MALVCDAITLATAVLLDQTTAAQSLKGTREVAEMMARDIRGRVREVRAIYKKTGRRTFSFVPMCKRPTLLPRRKIGLSRAMFVAQRSTP